MTDGASLSSHVLDLERGQPAEGMTVTLYKAGEGSPLASGVTNDDGRISAWQPAINLEAGDYRAVFATGAWFDNRGEKTFYPEVSVSFRVDPGSEHYHVPLLISAYGYSTYRGS